MPGTLGRFLLASAMLHLAVLALWRNGHTDPPPAADRLAFELVMNRAPALLRHSSDNRTQPRRTARLPGRAPARPSHRDRPKRIARTRSEMPAPAAHTNPVVTATAACGTVRPGKPARELPAPAATPPAEKLPERIAAPPAAAPAPAPADQPMLLSSAEKQALLRRALQGRLAFHRYYPPLARRRGWEGRVRLGLRVEADGRLSHVRVVHSSGYATLDRAAVDSLRKVSHLREARHWLNGRHFDMVLPVAYKLLDG